MSAESPGRELENYVAIVTGSARNIGRAIALELANAGATIAVHARTSRQDGEEVVREIEERGGGAKLFLAELTDPAVVGGMIEAVKSEFGRIDILVNNAAMRGDASIEEITYDAWRKVLASILDSAFLCSQAALPHLTKSGRGAIVSIAGVAAHTGIEGRAHVVTAKTGLIGLTRALSAELAGRDITVNCVSPGYMNTKRDHIPPHFLARPVPMKRPGEPEEIATAVRFLCGPGARYVTGQAIQVSGGWHIG